MQLCQFTKSFVMFHHIILNGLFPTGAQVISPEAFSFRCDSKTLCSQEQRKGRSMLEAQGACTPLFSMSYGNGPALVNSHYNVTYGDSDGPGGGGKTMHQRCELRVMGGQRKRRLFITERYHWGNI